MVDDLHVTLGRLFQESVEAMATELKKARARAERAEAEAAALRVTLQSLRRRIDDIIQVATKEHRDLYWLDDGVTQMVKADADAALASDAGRAMLERVRKLERVLEKAKHLREYVAPFPDEAFPRIDHVCGDPSTTCDMDCVAAASMAQRNEAIREFDAALAALEADDSTSRKEEKHDDNRDEQPGA